MDLNQGGRAQVMRWSLWIIGLTVLIYARSLSNGFIWDDHDYLVDNPSMGSLTGLLGFWTLSDAFSAFPLTVSALWIQHALWGLAPLGYHGVSLTLHVLNALLLFGVLRRLAPPIAGAAALLFAIHPIQVETVAWIAEQKNLWCFFFMMLATMAFLDFDASGKKRHFVWMGIFYTAALLSKSIAICFGVIPLLFAWWKRGSISRGEIFRALPLFLLGVLSILIPLHNESVGSGSNLSGLFLWEKFLLAGKNFFFYIKQIVLPWRFLTLYPKWDPCVTCVGDWVFPAGVVVLYGILWCYRGRIGRGPFALLVFYGASIFPALGILKVSLLSITDAADHFSYLAVPPILILFVSGVLAAHVRISDFSRREVSTLKLSLAIGVVFFLSVVSFRLTLNYKNDIALFGQLKRESPGSFFAHSRFGIVCLENPALCTTEKAIESLEMAVTIGPDESLTLAKLALAYERKGLLEQAKQCLWRASVGQDPFSQAYYIGEIGRICSLQKKIKESIFFLEKSLSLRAHPEYSEHRERHRRFYRGGGHDVGKSINYYLLGQVYFLSGDFKRAVEYFSLAIEDAPERSQSYAGLGPFFANQGDLENAFLTFRAACRKDPDSAIAKINLEYALKRIAGKEIK